MELNQTRIKITHDMIKNFKTVECDCGGKVFHTGIVFKKVSALLSPTGREELYPIEVIICDKCGKVPSEFNNDGMLPDEIIAKKSTIIK